MPKKSRASQEIEAMEFAARRELAEVETARAKIAARLDTLQDMKTRMEKDPMRRKPKQPSWRKPSEAAVCPRNSQEEEEEEAAAVYPNPPSV